MPARMRQRGALGFGSRATHPPLGAPPRFALGRGPPRPLRQRTASETKPGCDPRRWRCCAASGRPLHAPNVRTARPSPQRPPRRDRIPRSERSRPRQRMPLPHSSGRRYFGEPPLSRQQSALAGETPRSHESGATRCAVVSQVRIAASDPPLLIGHGDARGRVEEGLGRLRQRRAPNE